MRLFGKNSEDNIFNIADKVSQKVNYDGNPIGTAKEYVYKEDIALDTVYYSFYDLIHNPFKSEAFTVDQINKEELVFDITTKQGVNFANNNFPNVKSVRYEIRKYLLNGLLGEWTFQHGVIDRKLTDYNMIKGWKYPCKPSDFINGYDETGLYLLVATAYSSETPDDKFKIAETKIRFNEINGDHEKKNKSGDNDLIVISDYQNNTVKLFSQASSNLADQLPSKVIFSYACQNKGVNNNYTTISEVNSTINDKYTVEWNMSELHGGEYKIKIEAIYPNGEISTCILDRRLTRSLTLSFTGHLDLKPQNTKLFGTHENLDEIDTLYVKMLKSDAARWGEPVPYAKNESDQPVLEGKFIPTVPAYKEEGDYITYKFSFDYSGLDEGWYNFGARLKNDPASCAEVRTRAARSSFWEPCDTDPFANGWKQVYNNGFGVSGTSGWSYNQAGYGTNTSGCLRAFSVGFQNHRSELLSPPIKVPDKKYGHTFVYYDYARDLSISGIGSTHSACFAQYADASGKRLDKQPLGSSTFQSVENNPSNPNYGWEFNLPESFHANPPPLGDFVWRPIMHWMTYSGEGGSFDVSGRTVHLKFTDLHFATSGQGGSQGAPVCPTTHYLDNFKVLTLQKINEQPLLDRIPVQMVVADGRERSVLITGLSDGEGQQVKLTNGSKSRDPIVAQCEQLMQETIKKAKRSKEYSGQKLTITASVESGSELVKLRPITWTEGSATANLVYSTIKGNGGRAVIKVLVTDDGKQDLDGDGLDDHNGIDTVSANCVVNIFAPPAAVQNSLAGDTKKIINAAKAEVSVDLANEFEAKNNAGLQYKVLCSESAPVSWALNGSVLSFAAKPQLFGTAEVVVNAVDTLYNNAGGSETALDTFFVKVVHDGVFVKGSIPNAVAQSSPVMGSYNLDDFFGCDEGSISYTASGSGGVSCSINGSVVSFNKNEIGTGIVNITATWQSQKELMNHKLTLLTAQKAANKAKSSSVSLTFAVVAGNVKPVLVKTMPDTNVVANFTGFRVGIADCFVDYNFDYLTYEVVYDSAKVSCLVDGDSLLIESIANTFGEARVIVSASDREYTVPDTFKVIIESGAMVPYLAKVIPDTSLDEDFGTHTINLNNYFVNPLGTPLNYAVQADTMLVKCSIKDSLLIISSKTDLHGSESITVSIINAKNSPFKARYTTNCTFNLTIMPVNDLPVLVSTLPDLNLPVNFNEISFNLNQHFADTEHGSLSYAVDFNADIIRCSVQDSVLHINSIDGVADSTDVIVKCIDTPNMLTDTLRVYVGNTFDQPHLLTQVPDQNLNEDFGQIEINLDNYFTQGTEPNTQVVGLRFDGNASDSYGNEVTLHGGITPDNFSYNQSCTFDGVDDYVQVKLNNGVPRPFSLSFWVENGNNTSATLLQLGNNLNEENSILQINEPANNTRTKTKWAGFDLGFRFDTDNLCSVTLMQNGYHHIMVTSEFDGVKVYVNGQLSSEYSYPILSKIGGGNYIPEYLKKSKTQNVICAL